MKKNKSIPFILYFLVFVKASNNIYLERGEISDREEFWNRKAKNIDK